MKPDLNKTNKILDDTGMRATGYAAFGILSLEIIQRYYSEYWRGLWFPSFYAIDEQLDLLKSCINNIEIEVNKGRSELEEYQEAIRQENKRISE